MYEPVAMATVPQIGDTFTAAHSARISALALTEKAERLKDELAPLLESCRQAVVQAREDSLFAVDVPMTGHRPELLLALSRALEDRGFTVRTSQGRLTLGWQPAPMPRPPVYRNGQAALPSGFPLPRRDLLRETPEEVGPPE